MCREIQMGVAAAQWALHDAQLDPGNLRSGSSRRLVRCRLHHDAARGIRGRSTGLPGRGTATFDYELWSEKGMPNVTPLWLLKYLPNMPACHVAIYNDFRGPNNSITVREASANLAVAEAYSTIVRGEADVMLAGATGSRIHPLRTVHTVLQEQLAMDGERPESRLAPLRSSPQRNGGGRRGRRARAGRLAQAAEKRGANVLGEILGYGASAAVDRQAVALRDRR